MQIHDCTAVVDHKMESELYRHETFRLEQFDMSPSFCISLFAISRIMQVDQVSIKLDSAIT